MGAEVVVEVATTTQDGSTTMVLISSAGLVVMEDGVAAVLTAVEVVAEIAEEGIAVAAEEGDATNHALLLQLLSSNLYHHCQSINRILIPRANVRTSYSMYTTTTKRQSLCCIYYPLLQNH